jgi:uncharacterized protein YfaP (DUF2135 family)
VLTDPDSGVIFIVPAGALDQPIELTAQLAAENDPSMSALPPGSSTKVFHLGPEGTQFAFPIMVGLPLSSAAEPGSFTRARVFDGSWRTATLADGSPTLALTDGEGARAYVITDHFSTWSVDTQFTIFGDAPFGPSGLQVPSLLFTETAAAGAIVPGYLLDDSARQALYENVFLELVTHSAIVRTAGELGGGRMVTETLAKTSSVSDVARHSAALSKLLQSPTLKAFSNGQLEVLEDSAKWLDKVAFALDAAQALSECALADSMIPAMFAGMDLALVRDRFLAFQSMAIGSRLFQSDSAYRAALASVGARLGANGQASDAAAFVHAKQTVQAWLQQTATDQCEINVLEVVAGEVAPDLAAGLLASYNIAGPEVDVALGYLWDYVIADQIFKDAIGGTKRQLVLAALGSILNSGLVLGPDVTEWDSPASIDYGNEGERLLWQRREALAYVFESIRRSAADALELSDTSAINRADKAIKDFFVQILHRDAPPRDVMIQILEQQEKNFGTARGSIAAAIPDACVTPSSAIAEVLCKGAVGCGIATPSDTCNTCLDASCCEEAAACWLDGSCRACAESGQMTCSAGPLPALAACQASKCAAQCADAWCKVKNLQITSPVANGTLLSRVVQVAGTFEDPDNIVTAVDVQVTSLLTGTTLTQTFQASNGQFSANNLVVAAGQNEVKASIHQGACNVQSDPVDFLVDVKPATILVTLTWDEDATDVDLYMHEPPGNDCYYSASCKGGQTSLGGTLDTDDTNGYGPENYSLSELEGDIIATGGYPIRVHYYAGAAPIHWHVRVVLYENQPAAEVVRHYDGMLSTANHINQAPGGAGPDWNDVATVSCQDDGMGGVTCALP